MDIEMIILDLDGTILRSDKSVSDYTLTVLERCRERGIKIVVATARSETAAQRYLEKLKPDAIISNGGALARYQGNTVYTSVIPADTADTLISELIRLPGYVEITVEAEDGYYVSWQTPSASDYAHAVYYDFGVPLMQDVYKITVHFSNTDGLFETAEKYPSCGVLAFSDGPWYRLASRQAVKMTAIRELAAYLNVDISRTAAFGDDYIDEEMIRSCGIGVAMGNGVQQVRNEADDVCESNDNDGVAKWLEERLLGN